MASHPVPLSHTESLRTKDGEYLVCGNSFGRICVWQLSIFLNAKSWEQNKTQEKRYTPQHSFQAHSGPVYSITTADSVLISGGDEEIRVWRWSDVVSAIKAQTIVPIHELKTKQSIYSRGSLSMYAETNGIAYDSKRKYIFGACGDNTCYIWDANNFQLVSTLQGHTNYLHAVCAMPATGRVCTASEDGSVKIWDTNTSQQVETITVHSGKWVGAMAMDRSETWLVCGGGGKELVQYYLPTCSKSWSVATSGYIQALSFVENKIVSAGNENYLYHYSFGGDLIKKVRTSIPSVFSVSINHQSRKNQVLIATGSSPTIDAYTPDYANVTSTLCFR